MRHNRKEVIKRTIKEFEHLDNLLPTLPTKSGIPYCLAE